MFAVIKTGGKQYKVAEGDVLRVEKLPAEPGGTVSFQSVMMVGDGSSVTVGAPFVDGATVAAEVVEQTRGDKIIVFKKKRRKGYRRRHGHRQDLTVLRISEILTGAKAPAAAKARKQKAAAAKAEAKAAPEAPTEAEATAEIPAAAPEQSEE
jgi:large subunit ribosomal protein L21